MLPFPIKLFSHVCHQRAKIQRARNIFRQIVEDNAAMDTMNAVDRQRVELEANMGKLEKALRHWQTWDAEYEGLKEELQELDDGAGADEIVCEDECWLEHVR